MQLLSPQTISAAALNSTVQQKGYAVLSASSVAEWADCPLEALLALSPDWDDMPPDNYLKDGGRYRRRLHSSFVFDKGSLTQVPHRAHWQPLDYNALHGGMERWFEPMHEITLNTPAWTKLLTALARTPEAVRAKAVSSFVQAGVLRVIACIGSNQRSMPPCSAL